MTKIDTYLASTAVYGNYGTDKVCDKDKTDTSDSEKSRGRDVYCGKKSEDVKSTKNNGEDKKLSDTIKECLEQIEANKKHMEELNKKLAENKYDVNSTARKIARGRNVSKEELEFLRKKNERLYRKALLANEQRSYDEKRLRSTRNVKKRRQYINSMKLSNAFYKDTEFAGLCSEATSELEARYCRGVLKNKVSEKKKVFVAKKKH